MSENNPKVTKRFALLPSERAKPCPHEHVAYRGRIPNTGPLVCHMCGETFEATPREV